MSLARRTFNRLALTGLAAAAAPALLPASANASNSTSPDYAPVRSDSAFGSYTQKWFVESFLELGDDLKEAHAAGKRFAIVWELEGCPYCRETHLVNFAIPAVTDFIRPRFAIVQLDVRGSRRVKNFDGTEMSERELAALFQIRHTPTIQFFPETLAETKGKKGRDVEVGRIPGYLRPFHFLTFFQFVAEKAYALENFHKYLKARVAQLEGSGKGLPAW
ncbi:MAG: thioredoxin family protein [Rhodospirillaceae bacterium]